MPEPKPSSPERKLFKVPEADKEKAAEQNVRRLFKFDQNKLFGADKETVEKQQGWFDKE